MAYLNLHEDDIVEFKQVFSHFDKNNIGKITVHQLGIALRCLEPKPSEVDIKRVVRNVEHGNDGSVNLQEFLDILQKVIENTKNKPPPKNEKPTRKRSCYTNLPAEQIESIRDAFNTFDINGDGTISADELKAVMKSVGQEVTEREIRQMLKEVSNTRNHIEFSEFLTMMTRKISNGGLCNELFETFRFFDTDGDGSISAEEIKSAMEKLGEQLSNDEIEEMIREADINGDGKVDYAEFMKMVSNPKP